MNLPLAGKRALVTGASGAIGSAIAQRLAAAGAHVLLHANSRPDAVQALATTIAAAGGSAEGLTFDITDDAATSAATARLLEGGPVQIVVNNAGIHDDAVFPGMRPEQWHRVIDVSLHGFFRVTQPLVLPMLRTRWGRIVNVSSVAAIAGNRGQVNYAAAKGALHSATKALSLELASRGVTVNAVAPGIIESPMAPPPSMPTPSSAWCRCSAPAGPTRWRRWWASWPAPRPVTSPDRSSRSTAA
jgi:3-oxoacyl-[acyl-carrier protein] reductase